MKVTQGWCDICGQEIKDGNVITISTPYLKHGIQYDLCLSCLDKLSKWMQDQRKENGLEEKNDSTR